MKKDAVSEPDERPSGQQLRTSRVGPRQKHKRPGSARVHSQPLDELTNLQHFRHQLLGLSLDFVSCPELVLSCSPLG